MPDRDTRPPATDRLSRPGLQRRLRRRTEGTLLAPVRSVRTLIVGLILVVTLPALAFSAFLVLRSAHDEQDNLANTVRQRAETAAQAVDLLLGSTAARLQGLAGSFQSDPDDLQSLYHTASMAMGSTHPAVTLSDPTGHQLFNTQALFGDQLPMDDDLGAIHRVVQTDRPYVSNLSIATLTGQPQVTVSVPVRQHGRVAYVLSADVLPMIRQLLVRLQLPSDWLCMISDRDGLTLARTRAGDRFVGQLSRPGFLARVRSAASGWFAGVTRDNQPSYVGFTHVSLAGWSLAIAIPARELLRPVRRSTRMLLLAGGAVLALGLLAAFGIARGISRPIIRLVQQAQAVGLGARVEPIHTGLRETDAVARSLHLASEQLAQHALERDEAMARLRDSEGRFRTLAEELGRANAERTRLLHGTVRAQEAERARVARELHDSLGQYVTALRLGLKAVAASGVPDAAARRQLTALDDLTAEAGRELNRLAWELRPTALDDLGLEIAVRQLVETWMERSGLHFDLHLALGTQRLPPEVETALYRILQEAITNAVKHAQATRISVILEATEVQVRLIVEDNGKGIPADRVTGSRRLGLAGIRERLALVKGALEVECSPGEGTTLFARVPL